MRTEFRREALKAFSGSLAPQRAKLLTVVGALLASLASPIPHSSQKARADSFEIREPDSSQYVNSKGCQPCHSEIYKTYYQGAMARSFYRPTLKNVIEDYTTNNHLFHASS